MSLELTLQGMIRGLRTGGDDWPEPPSRRRARVLARLRARREAEAMRRAAGPMARGRRDEGDTHGRERA